jgi:hypothetical protein
MSCPLRCVKSQIRSKRFSQGVGPIESCPKRENAVRAESRGASVRRRGPSNHERTSVSSDRTLDFIGAPGGIRTPTLGSEGKGRLFAHVSTKQNCRLFSPPAYAMTFRGRALGCQIGCQLRGLRELPSQKGTRAGIPCRARPRAGWIPRSRWLNSTRLG